MVVKGYVSIEYTVAALVRILLGQFAPRRGHQRDPGDHWALGPFPDVLPGVGLCRRLDGQPLEQR